MDSADSVLIPPSEIRAAIENQDVFSWSQAADLAGVKKRIFKASAYKHKLVKIAEKKFCKRRNKKRRNARKEIRIKLLSIAVEFGKTPPQTHIKRCDPGLLAMIYREFNSIEAAWKYSGLTPQAGALLPKRYDRYLGRDF